MQKMNLDAAVGNVSQDIGNVIMIKTAAMVVTKMNIPVVSNLLFN